MEAKFKPKCRLFKCTLCCLSHMQSQSSEMFTGQLLDWPTIKNENEEMDTPGTHT